MTTRKEYSSPYGGNTTPTESYYDATIKKDASPESQTKKLNEQITAARVELQNIQNEFVSTVEAAIERSNVVTVDHTKVYLDPTS